MSWLSRLANVFRSGRVQSELDDELQFHIDERIHELTASGLTRAAAAAEVARRFGSPLRLREQSLDVKLLPWLDSIVRDIGLGARMLRKNAVVTTAAVLSLSLALGACVAAFSLVDALRPPPRFTSRFDRGTTAPCTCAWPAMPWRWRRGCATKSARRVQSSA